MSDNQTQKASYHQPTFSIYGTLSDLTKSGGQAPNADSTNVKSNDMSMN